MINYPKYEQPTGGKFIKLKALIPNEGDELKLKLVSGKIAMGSFGVQQLTLDVLMMVDGKPEHKELSCDAPDEKNEHVGSQLYRGFVDNNIQEGDVFYIQNGGRMNNKYKTVIYNVLKDGMAQPPATVEQVKEAFAPEVTPAPQEEEINIEDIPF